MTVRARDAKAARRNAGVYSGKHGQRRLYLRDSAAPAGRCCLPAALVCGGYCSGVACPVRLLILSRSGACDSSGTGGGGVSRRRLCGGGNGGRERGKAGKASEYFSGGLERAREPIAGGGNDYEGGIPAGKIPGGDARAGISGKRTKHFHAFDGSWRNSFQADCGIDRAEGCLLEESRRKGGSRRAHWTGTIRVARGPVGSERGGDPGEGGRECEGRIEWACDVAHESCSR